MILGRASLVLALALAGCTEVRPQPPAPVVSEPAAAPAAKPAAARPSDRRPQRTQWLSAGASAAEEAKARAKAAAARPAEVALPANDKPQREQLQKVLDTALPTLTSCWSGETALSTAIAFEATGAGKAENIRMPGASPASARCVAERLRGLQLPTYTGPVISIQIPVTVNSTTTMRPAAAQPGAAAAQAAAPSPPQLFVKP